MHKLESIGSIAHVKQKCNCHFYMFQELTIRFDPCQGLVCIYYSHKKRLANTDNYRYNRIYKITK